MPTIILTCCTHYCYLIGEQSNPSLGNWRAKQPLAGELASKATPRWGIGKRSNPSLGNWQAKQPLAGELNGKLRIAVHGLIWHIFIYFCCTLLESAQKILPI